MATAETVNERKGCPTEVGVLTSTQSIVDRTYRGYGGWCGALEAI